MCPPGRRAGSAEWGPWWVNEDVPAAEGQTAALKGSGKCARRGKAGMGDLRWGGAPGRGGVTLCRPRQCSSATSWWKFPSVTFSVSSKDSRGFCHGDRKSVV